MRDFLPQDVRRREYVIGVVEDVYRGYGFQPLETPALENIETLTGKYGEEGNKLIFKVLRRGEHESSGETDLALRYDLTVPLARVVAEHRGKLPRFFKRYQIQPVWRADRPARGRFREFYQCDVDAIGSRSMVVETELCAAVADVLQRLGFQDFVIRLNDRRILSGLLDAAGVPADLHGQALVALDKMDKIGPDGVRRELQERGIAADGERVLAAFSPQATTGDVRRFLDGRDEALAAVDALDEVFALSAATSAGAHLRFDVSLARGLSYYTGAIMEITVPDLAGSLGGGGRYDGLIGMFLGENIPGLRLLAGPRAHPRGDGRARDVSGQRRRRGGRRARDAVRGRRPRRGAAPGARAARSRPSRRGVSRARQARQTVQVRRCGGDPEVAVLGADERASGVVTIKDMTSGKQQAFPRGELPARLAGADEALAGVAAPSEQAQ